MIVESTQLAALQEDSDASERLRLEWTNNAEYADARAIEEAVLGISQGVWGASLMADIEFSIWEMIQNPHDVWSEIAHPYCSEDERQEMLAIIRAGTVDVGRFFVYDITSSPFDARFVRLDEWEVILEKEKLQISKAMPGT